MRLPPRTVPPGDDFDPSSRAWRDARAPGAAGAHRVAGAPLSWIARGWRDFVRTPVPSLLHGLIAAFGGTLVLAVAHQHFYLVSGAFSGFVLVAPVLVTGLYELSRGWRWANGRRCTTRSGRGSAAARAPCSASACC